MRLARVIGSRTYASRRLGRRWLMALCIVALVLAIIADRNGWLLVRQVDDLATYHGVKAQVNGVIDGDTLEVALPDTLNRLPVTRIRLWGVDCPETARFGQPQQPWSREASNLASALIGGRSVIMFLEPHQQRDSFSRVLAHIEIADGENAGRSLNEALLEAGLARADERWPHSRLTRYAQLENAARRRGVGVWSKPAATRADASQQSAASRPTGTAPSSR
jgi:endonuclease YncB( thermonuclease family)